MFSKTRLGLAGLAGGVLLLMVACAPAPAQAPAAPPAAKPAEAPQLSRLAPGTPKRGGKFILATHDDVTSWDAYTEGSGSRLKQYSMVQDSLLNWPPSKSGIIEGVECNLCEKWEQPNPTTYIFHLSSQEGGKVPQRPGAGGR